VGVRRWANIDPRLHSGLSPLTDMAGRGLAGQRACTRPGFLLREGGWPAPHVCGEACRHLRRPVDTAMNTVDGYHSLRGRPVRPTFFTAPTLCRTQLLGIPTQPHSVSAVIPPW